MKETPSLTTTTFDSSLYHSRSVPPGSSQASSSGDGQSRTLPQHPPDRIPGPKSSTQSGRFKLGKTRPEKEKRKHGRKNSLQVGEEDEDWFQLVDGPSTISTNTDPTVFPDRNHGSITPESPVSLYDSQLTQVPVKEVKEKEKDKKRGRGLAKKTSQLFSRSSRDKEKDTGQDSPETGPSLNLPLSSRQNSHSSAASGDSHSTSTSSRHRFSARPNSSSSRNKSPRSSHSRRLSQDSASSWHAPPLKTGRSGSTSTYDSPIEHHLPIPQRQASHLSASVPTLTRQSMPPTGSSPLDNGGTLPSRMSNWFSHLLPSSSATSLQPMPEPTTSSPQKKNPSAAALFLSAARQRAVDGVRHLLVTEAQPDKCSETIWVLGSPHPGYRPSTPLDQSTDLPEGHESESRRGSSSSEKHSPPNMKSDQGTLRPPTWKRNQQPTSPPAKGFGNLFSASTVSLALPGNIGSPSKDDKDRTVTESPKGKKSKTEKEVLKWPEDFHDDFRSRVWCTYRSQYAPILSLPNDLLIPSPEAYYSAFGPPIDVAPAPSLPIANNAQPQARLSSSPWSWSRSEGGLTSDAGWGCMLRTGQSMLANALIHLHLGRHWRLPPAKPTTAPSTPLEVAQLESYATYVKIISWFMDDPSPLCPFSVHRMALIGKELGKEVGEWFGPSTAAGALKTLANSFPLCGLAVATAADSIVYKSDVFSASHLPSKGWTDSSVKTENRDRGTHWGSKSVLVLIGIRLGLDGVNPIYHDSVKALFTFPQSVGIAGGRPSSSYYFVASQANSLFYLDPHFTRPAIPLEIPPASPFDEEANPQDEIEEPVVVDKPAGQSYTLDVVDVDDVSDTDSDSTESGSRRDNNRTSSKPKRGMPGMKQPAQLRRATLDADPFALPSTEKEEPATIHVDPRTVWYANAYPEAALKTFHCDRVKKLPLSGLDPSMLLGFLIADEEDFDDFTKRVNNLPQKIFTVQDEPPSWDDDDDTGLESVSEPDMDELEVEMGKLNPDNGDISGSTIQPIPMSNNRQEGWDDTGHATPGKRDYANTSNDKNGAHGIRPQPVPLKGRDGGMETESWVQPRKEGEAPNGASVL